MNRNLVIMPVSYRGTSLVNNTPLLGPYSRTIPRVLWWSHRGGLFIVDEVFTRLATCDRDHEPMSQVHEEGLFVTVTVRQRNIS